MNIDLSLNLLRGVRDRNSFIDPGYVLALDRQINYIAALRAELEAANSTESQLRDENRQCVADNHAKCDAVEKLQTELTEARRVIDEARNQEPTAWRPKFDIEGDWSLGEPSIESIEYWHEQGVEIEYAYLRAAPVPAQPSAVPEAVAKVPVDPDVETLKRMHEAYWGSSTSNYWHENSEPLWRKTYAAILSAADTEVKK